MKTRISDTYKGWTISVNAADNQDSHFSFDISNPSGYSQHVKMGGINEQRAFERAREMIDMEIAMNEEE
jgi:hypothetical protein